MKLRISRHVKFKRSVFVALVFVSCTTSSVNAVELVDLLFSARDRDPNYAIAKAQLLVSHERGVQARATLLPSANATLANNRTQYEQDFPPKRQFWTTNWAVQINQPIFRPANFYNLSQAEKFEAQAKAQLAAAESDLAERVASAWFDVLVVQENSKALQSQRDATQQQLLSAKRSFDVGVVSIADVREVEAKHAVVLAQLSLSESELEYKRAYLEQLAGAPIGELDSTAWMKPNLQEKVNSLQFWLASVQVSNPTIIQARYQLQASRDEISKARAGRLPTIDAVATKSKNATTGSTFSENEAENQSWQVGVQVAVPIFSGLSASAKIKEAIAMQDRALGERDLAVDQVSNRVKQAYFALRGAIAQLSSLELALSANNVAVQANRKGYQVGVRTNVEVLNAMAQYYQSEKDLTKARTDAWLNYMRLRIETGKWSEEDLRPF